MNKKQKFKAYKLLRALGYIKAAKLKNASNEFDYAINMFKAFQGFPVDVSAETLLNQLDFVAQSENVGPYERVYEVD